MNLFEEGKLFIGCNYWASHAGTNMWSDWRPEVIEADFARLAESRIKVLRIFPLWSDFQPLRFHRGGGGSERELRLREEPLPQTEAGQAGLDAVMPERFSQFCDIAEKYDIRLIVGLITGWMSGRMHMPEAFAGKALISDPLVVRWQVRFVRYMVRHFKDKPAIVAWDLGNECNALGTQDRNQAFIWTTIISDTIKLEDNTRPVVSGMHSLSPTGIWTPEDQGEALDILCTHPYTIFTPHCNTDPLNRMKTILHSTAESVYYENLSGKPCFIEEIGTLGPMVADEDVAADFIRTALISAWAHDLRGFVWWCANEQAALTHTPYDWDAVERELGLFRLDGSKKPVVETFSAFSETLEKWESTTLPTLPKRITDAVCVLTQGQDIWATAFGSFLLAKQAGLDITFAWCHDALPNAPVYMLPNLTGTSAIWGHELQEILRRVREEGATLYLSISDALLSPFSAFTGVKVKTRCKRGPSDAVTLDGIPFSMYSPFRLETESIGARVLASDSKGIPVFTCNTYGLGKVYTLMYPIEFQAGTTPGIIDGEGAVPLYRFYEAMQLGNPERCFSLEGENRGFMGLTEHPMEDGRRAAVLINYTPEERQVTIALGAYKIDDTLFFSQGTVDGDRGCVSVTLPANTGVAFVCQKA